MPSSCWDDVKRILKQNRGRAELPQNVVLFAYRELDETPAKTRSRLKCCLRSCEICHLGRGSLAG